MREHININERFWSYVDVQSDTECWNWLGGTVKGRYGKFKVNGKHVGAHRLAYELLVGDIPQGLELDHVCRNTLCVNPNHLEPVTHKVNVLRGFSFSAHQSRQTHCKRGHGLSGDNLYIRPDGHRSCKECMKLRKLGK
jgi:hypothetical protein